MSFDFDCLNDRNGTGSIKWDRRTKRMKDIQCFPMSYADMDLKTAPAISEALAHASVQGIYGYTDPDEEYLLSVIGWMQGRHGWRVAPEWIVCTGGVLPAISGAIRAFTKAGDQVIVQKPGYYLFDAAIENNGCEVIENCLIKQNGRYTIDFEDLAQKVSDPRAKIFILCSPHNPVGRVWTCDELQTLGQICIENGVLMIADEIHFDIVYPPNRHTVFASISDEFAQNSITCTSPSKVFNLAGLKNANIIIPNDSLRQVFAGQFETDGYYHIGYFARAATIAAYNEGGAWMQALLKYIQDNDRVFTEFLTLEFPEVAKCPLEGTYLAWTDCRAWSLGQDALERFMVGKAKLALDEGYIFGTGGSGFERWNLALPRRALEENLQRLAYAAHLSSGPRKYIANNQILWHYYR